MNFANSRPTYELAHIVLANSAAGEDRDPIARLLHQTSNCRSTFQSCRCASRRKDTADSDLNQLFERVRKVVCGIERAVESHWQSPGRVHQIACALDVYTGVRSEDPRYDPRHASGSDALDVT